MWTAPIPNKQFDLEIDFLVDKKAAGKDHRPAASRFTAPTAPAEVLDRIKAQGFKYSTNGGHHRCCLRMRSSRPRKSDLLAEADEAGSADQPVSTSAVSSPTMPRV